jgi:hypothetical protein
MQAASEDELRVSLGLINYTTGKGKPSTEDTNRPIEVFMCSVVCSYTPAPAEWALSVAELSMPDDETLPHT